MRYQTQKSSRMNLPLHTTDQLVSDLLKTLNDTVEDCLTEEQMFGVTYLYDEVLTKFADTSGSSDKDRREAAIVKWLGVEDSNCRTNIRLSGISSCEILPGIELDDVLDTAARFVRRLLGDEPDLEELSGSFSGGASTSKRREVGVLARKYAEQADVTEKAWPLVQQLIMLTCGGWAQHNEYLREPRFVDGNVLFTVPKNAMIDRVACKEPDLNMFAQKAYGNFIRKRLKRVGIDLNDQRPNQRYACEGALTGSFATIDLSSASDTVTTRLVARLLPPSWFVDLDALRCEFTCIDGVWHENQMFSSMGNGFTFELETLIFWAIASAVKFHFGVSGRTVVYGDDIIVPSSVAQILVTFLSYCGFKVNTKKSFWEGRFRESCGKHYYGSVEVTPFYIRKKLSDVRDLIHVLNQFRAWCSNLGLNYGSRYQFWKRWAAQVPRKVYGGTDLNDKSRLCTPHTGGFRVKVEVRTYRKLEEELQVGLYLAWLNSPSIGTEIDSDPDAPRKPLARLTSDTPNLRIVRLNRPRSWEKESLSDEVMWVEELS